METIEFEVTFDRTIVQCATIKVRATNEDNARNVAYETFDEDKADWSDGEPEQRPEISTINPIIPHLEWDDETGFSGEPPNVELDWQHVTTPRTLFRIAQEEPFNKDIDGAWDFVEEHEDGLYFIYPNGGEPNDYYGYGPTFEGALIEADQVFDETYWLEALREQED